MSETSPRPTQPHYLRENKTERTPHRVLYLDTETRWQQQGAEQQHTLRLWAARMVDRDRLSYDAKHELDHNGTTAESLAALIDEYAHNRHALWVYAHNLNFDLTVTRLPVELVRLGWHLTSHALATEQPWARLAKRDRHIILADSWSWLPQPLAAIGEALGQRKPELPHNDGDETDWLTRCRGDVAILAAAMEELLWDWEHNGRGNWGITGPTSGWNWMRHVAGRSKCLIEPNPPAAAGEREAISGGRRQCWYRGTLPDHPLVELDAQHAFASVCASTLLPKRRHWRFDSLPIDHVLLGSIERGPVARCRVETETPRYPLQTPGGWFYPRGEFWTVLAGPEINEALERGELREIGAGYMYECGAYMRPWAQQVLQDIDPANEAVSALWKIAAKGFSRSVPGRWAVRVARVAQTRPYYGDGWEMQTGTYGDPPSPMKILSFAGERAYIVRDQDGQNSFPAVLAWIQSVVRVSLSRLIDALGPAVLSCNTDGLLLDPWLATGSLRRWVGERPTDTSSLVTAITTWLAAHCAPWAPLTYEVRNVLSGGQILSPQHYQLGGERKLAGVPRGARQVGPDAYAFSVWPKLPSQIEHSEPSTYTVRERVVHLAGVPVNGWLYQDGHVEPIDLRPGEPGTGPVLLPPGGGGAWGQHPLSEIQNAWLARQLEGLHVTQTGD